MAYRDRLLDDIRFNKTFLECNGDVNDPEFLKVYEELKAKPDSWGKAYYERRLANLTSTNPAYQHCLIPVAEMYLDLNLKKLHEIDNPTGPMTDEVFTAMLDALDDSPVFAEDPKPDDEDESETEKPQPKDKKQQPKRKQRNKSHTEKRKAGRPKKEQITLVDDMDISFDDIGWDE